MTKFDRNPNDWKKQKKGWPYKNDAMEDPQYMKDREELFHTPEYELCPYNGWWRFQGTTMWKQYYEKEKRKRKDN